MPSTTLSRASRLPCALLALLAAASVVPAQTQPQPPAFAFDAVALLADRLADRPHDDAPAPLPASLGALDYDGYRRIQHRANKAIWADAESPFILSFFHRGWLAKQRVDIGLVENGRAVDLPYNPELFDYGDLNLGTLPLDLGYAGFKILHPLNEPGKMDELAAFLGASYFRPLAKGLHYGLSLRGLAVDTGLPTGEEFPAFTRFWIEKPEPGASSITVYALLDSRSVTGAYQFTFDPGDTTLIDVRARLFPRAAINKLGVAPITSMYLHGESDQRPSFDFRPEVHDSDGLLLHAGGEWLWRPLANPRSPRISQFLVKDLRGYGLMQRDRQFTNYEDLEALYNDRPSAWVEPIEGFSSGKIDLFEISSDDEGMDNIVAAFVPDQPVAPGEELNFRYRVRIAAHDPAEHTGGKATATRRMYRPVGFAHKTITVPEGVMRFLIDFDGPGLDALDPAAVEKAESMHLVASATNANVSNRVAHYNREAHSWRAFMDVEPIDRTKPIDIRAFLKNGDDVLTETWTYTWNP